MVDIYKTAEGRQLVEAQYRECLAAWPVANQHVRVPTREGETFVVTCGPESAPPLILLHGSMANAASWPASVDIAALARHYRIHAVDTVGDSGFSAPSRPPLDTDAYALWLDDVLDAFGVARAAVAGTSLGGWLAIDYATRRPERVEAVAAMCPAGLAPRRVSFMVPGVALSLLGPLGRQAAMRLALGDRGKLTQDRARFDRLMRLVMQHMVLRRHGVPMFSDAALAALTMPVMAVLGGRDRIINSPETCNRLQRCVPHAQVRWLPATGHLIRDQTAPILAFLDEVWTA